LRFCSGVRPSTQVICTCGMTFLLERASLTLIFRNSQAFYLPV
jgi:hypothetical protein